MKDAADELLNQAHAAGLKAASRVQARSKDQSFLEVTLEKALAAELAGEVTADQSRRTFELEGFSPYPRGVDLVWTTRTGERVGIEVKVWDVLDSLFDVVKLATAVSRGHFDMGICVIAALGTHWHGGEPVTTMATPSNQWRDWITEDLLTGRARSAVLVSKGPRPMSVPATFKTRATEEVGMPRADTHSLRVFAIAAETGANELRLPTD